MALAKSTQKSGATPNARKYPRNFVAPTKDQLLKWFPATPDITVSSKAEHCTKCGKPFRKVSMEGQPHKICGCPETIK